MRIPTFTLAATLICLSVPSPLRAEGKTPRTSKGASTKSAAPSLGDLGMTERMVGTFIQGDLSTQLEGIQARLVPVSATSFDRSRLLRGLGTSKPVALYEVQLAGFLPSSSLSDEFGGMGPNAYLAVEKERVSVSFNRGKSWAKAENDSDGWLFSEGANQLRIFPAGSEFKPKEVRAMAVSGAAVVKHTRWTGDGTCQMPCTSDAVLVYGVDGHEARGLLKIPFFPLRVRLQGMKIGDRWVFETKDHVKAIGLFVRTTDRQRAGLTHVNWVSNLRVQVEQGVVTLSFKSDKVDWANADLVAQSTIATQAESANLIELPELAKAYEANWKRHQWTDTQEEDSFFAIADRMLVGKAIPFHMPPAFEGGNPNDRDFHFMKAKETFGVLQQQVDRLHPKIETMKVPTGD